MLGTLVRKIFRSRNDRLLRRYQLRVKKINELEGSLESLKDEQISLKTVEFRERLADGETLDGLLEEAFAVCREASKRVLRMRHFDVQLIGGMVLNDGKIAEMKTGEGKTLVATLSVYLNALKGNGVHVVTVNDYLAQHGARIMSPIYDCLGLTVGVNLSNLSYEDKQRAYLADVTYGTNNEFGFDYLRDNMVADLRYKVQRGLFFGIVDEVDSILIDEARTPLIISGATEDNLSVYKSMNKVVGSLVEQSTEDSDGDFYVDRRNNNILLSERGHENAENLLRQHGLLKEGDSLYSVSNISLMHHLSCALKAHNLFFKDKHYLLQDGQVVIIDEFTGRLMPGRRWSDGLHQAIESKEGVPVQRENQTLASITFQNYFRLYEKLSGMTGTAATEAAEFQQIYGLETVIIPTNKKMIRKDDLDQIYKNTQQKYKAILKDVKECLERGQPVLIGTASVESSEKVSGLLKSNRIKHSVLNAKNHAFEADIIAQAGKKGSITVATNMAGRGTDILLGGNPEKELIAINSDRNLSEEEKNAAIKKIMDKWQVDHQEVVYLGGLRVIGTERHEARRIDNQLRGRAGRQGDPGSSCFYLALDDPLLKIFAADKIAAIMDKLKMPEDEAIEHPWVSRSIENAQRKVEAANFDIRKQLLEYDDVNNDQRKVIYLQRNEILATEKVSEITKSMRDDVLSGLVDLYVPSNVPPNEWRVKEFELSLASYDLHLPLSSWIDQKMESEEIKSQLISEVNKIQEEKFQEKELLDLFERLERSILIQQIDLAWREHLSLLDHLRQGIHLRGYAQQNPKQVYKKEAFELFSEMLDRIKREVTTILLRIRIDKTVEMPSIETKIGISNREEVEFRGTPRNVQCPCGSGKKYKHCHGKLK